MLSNIDELYDNCVEDLNLLQDFLTSDVRIFFNEIQSDILPSYRAIIDYFNADKKFGKLDSCIVALELYTQKIRTSPIGHMGEFPNLHGVYRNNMRNLVLEIKTHETKSALTKQYLYDSQNIWAYPSLLKLIYISYESVSLIINELSSDEAIFNTFMDLLDDFLCTCSVMLSKTITLCHIYSNSDFKMFLNKLLSMIVGESSLKGVIEKFLQSNSLYLREVNQRRLNRLISMYNEPVRFFVVKEGTEVTLRFCQPFMVLSNISDTVIHQRKLLGHSLTEIRFEAASKLIIDYNCEQEVFMSLNLVFLSPEIEVVGEHFIDVSGLDCTVIAEIPRKTTEKVNEINGADGIDGAHGLPGCSGGNIFIQTACFKNSELLTIKSNGGHGGDGGPGGDGGDGENGDDGAIGEPKKVDGSMFAYRLIGRGSKGSNGGKGGQGGAPGLGGDGGYAGNVHIEVVQPTNILEGSIAPTNSCTISTEDGISGIASNVTGRGGAGGCPGKDGIDKLLYKHSFFSKSEEDYNVYLEDEEDIVLSSAVGGFAMQVTTAALAPLTMIDLSKVVEKPTIKTPRKQFDDGQIEKQELGVELNKGQDGVGVSKFKKMEAFRINAIDKKVSCTSFISHIETEIEQNRLIVTKRMSIFCKNMTNISIGCSEESTAHLERLQSLQGKVSDLTGEIMEELQMVAVNHTETEKQYDRVINHDPSISSNNGSCNKSLPPSILDLPAVKDDSVGLQDFYVFRGVFAQNVYGRLAILLDPNGTGTFLRQRSLENDTPGEEESLTPICDAIIQAFCEIEPLFVSADSMDILFYDGSIWTEMFVSSVEVMFMSLITELEKDTCRQKLKTICTTQSIDTWIRSLTTSTWISSTIVDWFSSETTFTPHIDKTYVSCNSFLSAGFTQTETDRICKFLSEIGVLVGASSSGSNDTSDKDILQYYEVQDLPCLTFVSDIIGTTLVEKLLSNHAPHLEDSSKDSLLEEVTMLSLLSEWENGAEENYRTVARKDLSLLFNNAQSQRLFKRKLFYLAECLLQERISVSEVAKNLHKNNAKLMMFFTLDFFIKVHMRLEEIHLLESCHWYFQTLHMISSLQFPELIVKDMLNCDPNRWISLLETQNIRERLLVSLKRPAKEAFSINGVFTLAKETVLNDGTSPIPESETENNTTNNSSDALDSAHANTLAGYRSYAVAVSTSAATTSTSSATAATATATSPPSTAASYAYNISRTSTSTIVDNTFADAVTAFSPNIFTPAIVSNSSISGSSSTSSAETANSTEEISDGSIIINDSSAILDRINKLVCLFDQFSVQFGKPYAIQLARSISQEPYVDEPLLEIAIEYITMFVSNKLRMSSPILKLLCMSSVRDWDVKEIHKINGTTADSSASADILSLDDLIKELSENLKNTEGSSSLNWDHIKEDVLKCYESYETSYRRYTKQQLATSYQQMKVQIKEECLLKKTYFEMRLSSVFHAMFGMIFAAIVSCTREKALPRHSQMLAVLLSLQTNNIKGTLLEVNTGEGKTMIVMILSLVYTMAGMKVDVITSNNVLAKVAVQKAASIFEIFEYSVGHNCYPDCEDRHNGYKNHVVYGEVSSFQRDYLLDHFHQKSIRGNRPFDIVIVDEVDSMLLDKGDHMLYLSQAIPGLEHLEALFLNIWIAVHGPDVSQGSRENVLKVKRYIEHQCSALEITYPRFLNTFVNSRLKKWIESAYIAKGALGRDDAYRVADGSQKNIVIMDKSTGVQLTSTHLSDGVHQFLQLKHLQEFKPETLKSIFISNATYFKKYQKLSGLSGTLGSDAESSIMSSVYRITVTSLPSFKQRRYKQSDHIITDTVEARNEAIVKVALEMRKQKRPCLIINDNIAEVKELVSAFKARNVAVTNYITDEQTFSEQIHETNIIVSTNLAGRGTDFVISPEIEKRGGLHIILTYVPDNFRIERQAFGRAARNGQAGSGQYIIQTQRQGNHCVSALDILVYERDQRERLRLLQLRSYKIRQLQLEEELLFQFRDNCLSKLVKQSEDEDEFILSRSRESCLEQFAFWLDDQKQNIASYKAVGGDSVTRQSLKDFMRDVNDQKESNRFHNFHYYLYMGHHYFEAAKNEKAFAAFEKVIAMEPDFCETAYYYGAGAIINISQERYQEVMNYLVRAKCMLSSKSTLMAGFPQISQRVKDFYISKGEGTPPDLYSIQIESKLTIFQTLIASIDRAVGNLDYDFSRFQSLSLTDGQRSYVLQQLEKSTFVKPPLIIPEFEYSDTHLLKLMDVLDYSNELRQEIVDAINDNHRRNVLRVMVINLPDPLMREQVLNVLLRYYTNKDESFSEEERQFIKRTVAAIRNIDVLRLEYVTARATAELAKQATREGVNLYLTSSTIPPIMKDKVRELIKQVGDSIPEDMVTSEEDVAEFVELETDALGSKVKREAKTLFQVDENVEIETLFDALVNNLQLQQKRMLRSALKDKQLDASFIQPLLPNVDDFLSHLVDHQIVSVKKGSSVQLKDFVMRPLRQAFEEGMLSDDDLVFLQGCVFRVGVLANRRNTYTLSRPRWNDPSDLIIYSMKYERQHQQQEEEEEAEEADEEEVAGPYSIVFDTTTFSAEDIDAATHVTCSLSLIDVSMWDGVEFSILYEDTSSAQVSKIEELKCSKIEAVSGESYCFDMTFCNKKEATDGEKDKSTITLRWKVNQSTLDIDYLSSTRGNILSVYYSQPNQYKIIHDPENMKSRLTTLFENTASFKKKYFALQPLKESILNHQKLSKTDAEDENYSFLKSDLTRMYSPKVAYEKFVSELEKLLIVTRSRIQIPAVLDRKYLKTLLPPDIEDRCRDKAVDDLQQHLEEVRKTYLVSSIETAYDDSWSEGHVVCTIQPLEKDLMDSFNFGLRDEIIAMRTIGVDGVLIFNNKPYWWGPWVVLLLGICQIIAGAVCCMLCLPNVGAGLIAEGIGDIMFAMESFMTGEFSWKAYLINKLISVCLSIITCGVSSFASKGVAIAKMGLKAVIKKIGKKLLQAVASVGISMGVDFVMDEFMRQLTDKIMSNIGSPLASVRTKLGELYQVSKNKAAIMQLMQKIEKQYLNMAKIVDMISRHFHGILNAVLAGLGNALKARQTNGAAFVSVEALVKTLGVISKSVKLTECVARACTEFSQFCSLVDSFVELEKKTIASITTEERDRIRADVDAANVAAINNKVTEWETLISSRIKSYINDGVLKPNIKQVLNSFMQKVGREAKDKLFDKEFMRDHEYEKNLLQSNRTNLNKLTSANALFGGDADARTGSRVIAENPSMKAVNLPDSATLDNTDGYTVGDLKQRYPGATFYSVQDAHGQERLVMLPPNKFESAQSKESQNQLYARDTRYQLEENKDCATETKDGIDHRVPLVDGQKIDLPRVDDGTNGPQYFCDEQTRLFNAKYKELVAKGLNKEDAISQAKSFSADLRNVYNLRREYLQKLPNVYEKNPNLRAYVAEGRDTLIGGKVPDYKCARHNREKERLAHARNNQSKVEEDIHRKIDQLFAPNTDQNEEPVRFNKVVENIFKDLDGEKMVAGYDPDSPLEQPALAMHHILPKDQIKADAEKLTPEQWREYVRTAPPEVKARIYTLLENGKYSTERDQRDVLFAAMYYDPRNLRIGPANRSQDPGNAIDYAIVPPHSRQKVQEIHNNQGFSVVDKLNALGRLNPGQPCWKRPSLGSADHRKWSPSGKFVPFDAKTQMASYNYYENKVSLRPGQAYDNGKYVYNLKAGKYAPK